MSHKILLTTTMGCQDIGSKNMYLLIKIQQSEVLGVLNVNKCFKHVFVQVKREVGDVSILINNAGIVTGKNFMDAPDSLIEKTLEVNTMAHFWVS